MGRVIVVGSVVVILAVLATALVVWLSREARRQRAHQLGLPVQGDLSRADEQRIIELLEHAKTVMHLALEQNLDDLNILNEQTFRAAEAWLCNYQKLAKRIPSSYQTEGEVDA